MTNMVSLITSVKKYTSHKAVKQAIEDLDIDATLNTLELVCKTHVDGEDDFKLAREYVLKALNKVKFDLETMHIKTKMHKEGYISRWRTLDLSKDKKRLSRSMKILRQRFRLMWTLTNNNTNNDIRNFC